MGFNSTCDATEENINVVIPQFLQGTVSRSPHRYTLQCSSPLFEVKSTMNTVGLWYSSVSHSQIQPTVETLGQHLVASAGV